MLLYLLDVMLVAMYMCSVLILLYDLLVGLPVGAIINQSNCLSHESESDASTYCIVGNFGENFN